MAIQIQLQSTNYNGQIAAITFYPCSGGSINLGSQVIPYNYTNEYYEGTYDLFFSAFSQTCQLVITCPTPTPTTTTTPTPTPTITPTNTGSPTPTPTLTPTKTLTPTPTPSPAGGFSPISIPNLQGWWKSDTNVVTDVNGVLTWTDIISGNTATRSGGNNFTNNTSVLNGYSGITQTGGANQFDLSTTYSLSAMTIFTVFNSVPDGVIMYWGGVSDGGFFTNYSLLPGLGIYNNPDVVGGGINITTPQYGTYYMDNANYVIRQNGTVVNTTAIGSGGNFDLNILFKGNTNGGSFGLNGSIWELLIYNRALSNPEITQVQNYLSTKYAL